MGAQATDPREPRRRQFIGRTVEIEILRDALSADTPSAQVLYMYGPGGIGKTALLREYVRLCEERRTAAHFLDGRYLEPSPHAFLAALGRAMGLDAGQSPLAAPAPRQEPRVVLLDTYEAVSALDEWIRETLLPQLPERLVLVLAGRTPPPTAWRADAGWLRLVRPLALRNLAPDESHEYLSACDVPAAEHDAVLRFTHGHPLALTLVADAFAQRPAMHFEPQAVPEVVHALVEQFVQKVPGPAHRAALEACALVYATTEGLLAEMLAVPDARELFNWLRSLSFADAGPVGLFPHDLAREALTADVRWRNPDWYAELHRRARAYYKRRMQQTAGEEQRRILMEYVYLHRTNPVIRAAANWQEATSVWQDALEPADVPALEAMVRRHEGGDAAAAAGHWLGSGRAPVVVLRSGHDPAGFMLWIALDGLSEQDAARDPVALRALRYVRQQGALRPGERAVFFRFWMAAEQHQDPSPAQSRIFTNIFQSCFNTERLALSLVSVADPDRWAPLMAYAEFRPVPELGFEVETRRCAVFLHDWRRMPLGAWLEALGQKEVGAEASGGPPAPQEELLVLSEAEFADAVRDALHDFHRPDLLPANPLLRSRLIVDCTGRDAKTADRVGALQRLIRRTVEPMQDTPQALRGYRVLQHTFLQPAPSQEKAAELLDLPFSTYRRYLKQAVQLLTNVLWQRELGS